MMGKFDLIFLNNSRSLQVFLVPFHQWLVMWLLTKKARGETSNKTKIGKVITVKLIQLYAMASIHLEKIPVS